MTNVTTISMFDQAHYTWPGIDRVHEVCEQRAHALLECDEIGSSDVAIHTRWALEALGFDPEVTPDEEFQMIRGLINEFISKTSSFNTA